MTYRVVCCCTHLPTQDYYCLQEYVKSLNGHVPFILDTSMGAWGGLATKTKWLRNALKDGLITEDILIVSDCWDFVFSKPLEVLIEKFKEYNSPCVISTEKNYWPEEGLKPEFDKHNFPTSYKYINSGLVVAEREALITILESMDLDNYPDDHRKEDGNMFHSNDQYLYQNEFVKQPVPIQIDYLCKINQTMSDVKPEELDLTGEYIKNIETGSEPCSFHFNGGSKTGGMMQPILHKLKLR